MTDYGEEQRNELEALESIYPDSFTGEPRGRRSQPPGVQWDGLELPPPIASRPWRRRHSEAAWPPARRSLLKFPQRVQAVRSNRDCLPFSVRSPKSRSLDKAGEVPGECQAWNWIGAHWFICNLRQPEA